MMSTPHTPPEIHAHLWRDKTGNRPVPGAMLRKGGGFIFIPREHLIAVASQMADIYETQETP
jgi:hypothetical protein